MKYVCAPPPTGGTRSTVSDALAGASTFGTLTDSRLRRSGTPYTVAVAVSPERARSVLLVTFLSQARVFLAMARDGLLPKSIFAEVHPKFRTPNRSTILTGVFIILAAVALFQLRVLRAGESDLA